MRRNIADGPKNKDKREIKKTNFAMNRKVILSGLFVVFCGALALSVGAFNRHSPTPVTRTGPAAAQDSVQIPLQARGRLQARLAMQPEADKLRRRLGERFHSVGREVTVQVGTLTAGADRHQVRIIRTQDSSGEGVRIDLESRPVSFTWSATEGARSGESPATGTDLDLIERLVFDSPDQFVLAQARGASYSTLARNVMPEGAAGSNEYTGPVWDVVRISEPENIILARPQSATRLYYINSSTGLLDRVISGGRGEAIVAEVREWVTRGSEHVPSRIVWNRNGQTVMELSLNNASHGPRQ